LYNLDVEVFKMTKEDVLEKYGNDLADYVAKWWHEAPLPAGDVEFFCPKARSSECKELWGFLTEPLCSPDCVSELLGVCVYSFFSPQEKLALLLTNHLEELVHLKELLPRPQLATYAFILQVQRDYPSGVYAYPSFRIRKTGEKWVPISLAPDSSIWHPRLGEASGNWLYEIPLAELKAKLKIELKECPPLSCFKEVRSG
jgi:hypothetical protein